MNYEKQLNKVNAIFEKHECYLLGASVETMAESFGSSEYDEYWWHDICYTRHFTSDMTLFMRLADILEGEFPKVHLKVQIKRHHYSAQFDNLKEYFEIQDFITQGERLINEINEELYKLNISEVEDDYLQEEKDNGKTIRNIKIKGNA